MTILLLYELGRFLGGGGASNSSSPTINESLPSNVDSDFIVVLASLLCALICVLGLVAVARCTWIRRISASADSPPPKANRGLKKKVIDSLPKLVFSPSASAAGKFTECAICITEFVAGDEIRALPQCGHGFHVECIDKWFGSHSSCPSCRQILVARCEKCGVLPPVSESSGEAAGETRIPMNGFLA